MGRYGNGVGSHLKTIQSSTIKSLSSHHILDKGTHGSGSSYQAEGFNLIFKTKKRKLAQILHR